MAKAHDEADPVGKALADLQGPLRHRPLAIQNASGIEHLLDPLQVNGKRLKIGSNPRHPLGCSMLSRDAFEGDRL
jgi:hypothetical protein